MVRELTIDTLINELITCARVKIHRCVLFCKNVRSLQQAYESLKQKKENGGIIGVDQLVISDSFEASLTFHNGSELVIKIFSDLDFRREMEKENNVLYESSLKHRVEALESIADDGIGLIVDDRELIAYLDTFKII